jgi:hypothetical protein
MISSDSQRVIEYGDVQKRCTDTPETSIGDTEIDFFLAHLFRDFINI